MNVTAKSYTLCHIFVEFQGHIFTWTFGCGEETIIIFFLPPFPLKVGKKLKFSH